MYAILFEKGKKRMTKIINKLSTAASSVRVPDVRCRALPAGVPGLQIKKRRTRLSSFFTSGLRAAFSGFLTLLWLFLYSRSLPFAGLRRVAGTLQCGASVACGWHAVGRAPFTRTADPESVAARSLPPPHGRGCSQTIHKTNKIDSCGNPLSIPSAKIGYLNRSGNRLF